jgi:hypothetical protein
MSNSIRHQEKRIARAKLKAKENIVHHTKRKPVILRATNHHSKKG